jgi:hypothetical protein
VSGGDGGQVYGSVLVREATPLDIYKRSACVSLEIFFNTFLDPAIPVKHPCPAFGTESGSTSQEEIEPVVSSQYVIVPQRDIAFQTKHPGNLLEGLSDSDLMGAVFAKPVFRFPRPVADIDIAMR